MTLEELQGIQRGTELEREDGAIGLVLDNRGGLVRVVWVDRDGVRSFAEITDAQELIPLSIREAPGLVARLDGQQLNESSKETQSQEAE